MKSHFHGWSTSYQYWENTFHFLPALLFPCTTVLFSLLIRPQASAAMIFLNQEACPFNRKKNLVLAKLAKMEGGQWQLIKP